MSYGVVTCRKLLRQHESLPGTYITKYYPHSLCGCDNVTCKDMSNTSSYYVIA